MEVHTYQTADGYTNTVFRIPRSKNSTIHTHGKVVIYQHGLLDCCVGIIADGEDSIGLKVVNQGYDLWLPNSRGNRYSKSKIPSWEFSFNEMAKYDQVALWKYVEMVTGKSDVIYIGHS